MSADKAGSVERCLAAINVTSGTAMDGPTEFRGFVTVEAMAEDGRQWVGQLDPETVRGMALQFLEVAEAAEQDAIVFTMLTRDIGLEPQAAGGFVAAMRTYRAEYS